MTQTTVSFIGLGAMGWHMAAHLKKSFAEVWVYNRTTLKAQEHAQTFNTKAVTIEQAVQADIIFTCLPTSHEVQQIIAAYAPKRGSIWVDCTSGEPEMAKTLAQQLQQMGCDFLDAPVSGQTIGAQNGTLTVMVGGSAAALAIAEPAINCFAGLIVHVGGSGAGFAVKAINNMLLAVNLWAAAEGFTALKAYGVDVTHALTCINASSGRSNATENILPQRVFNRQFPNTFALPLMTKDVGIATALGTKNELPLPVFNLINSLYAAANSHITQPNDFTTVVQYLEHSTGVILGNDTAE